VHPDEHEALDRQDGGGHHHEHRLSVEGVRDDQSDRADEFEDAEGHPGFPRQRAKRWGLTRYRSEAVVLCVFNTGEEEGLPNTFTDVGRFQINRVQFSTL
jgi:hypothetical protein